MVNSLPCLPIKRHAKQSKAGVEMNEMVGSGLPQLLVTMNTLYSLALSTHVSAPALSRHYLAKFMSIALLNEIEVPQTYTRTFCTKCFTIYIPGVNVTISSSRSTNLASFPILSKKAIQKQVAAFTKETEANISAQALKMTTTAPASNSTVSPAPLASPFTNPFMNPLSNVLNNMSTISINRNAKKPKQTAAPVTSLLGSITSMPTLLPTLPTSQAIPLSAVINPAKDSSNNHSSVSATSTLKTAVDNRRTTLIKQHDSKLKEIRMNVVSYKCLCCNNVEEIYQGINAFDVRTNNETWKQQLIQRVGNFSPEMLEHIKLTNAVKLSSPVYKKQKISTDDKSKLDNSTAPGQTVTSPSSEMKYTIRKLKRGGIRPPSAKPSSVTAASSLDDVRTEKSKQEQEFGKVQYSSSTTTEIINNGRILPLLGHSDPVFSNQLESTMESNEQYDSEASQNHVSQNDGYQDSVQEQQTVYVPRDICLENLERAGLNKSVLNFNNRNGKNQNNQKNHGFQNRNGTQNDKSKWVSAADKLKMKEKDKKLAMLQKAKLSSGSRYFGK